MSEPRPGSSRSIAALSERKYSSPCVGATASYSAFDSSSKAMRRPSSISTRATSAPICRRR